MQKTDKGIVVKTYNSFYYVKGSSEELVACKLRGRFKKEKFSLLVGDKVEFSLPETKTAQGNIEKILPRKNSLLRPAVANVDQIVLVFAAKSPDLNLSLLDRFLITLEQRDIPILICFSKVDLLKDLADIKKISDLYKNIGYEVLLLSQFSKSGLDEIKNILTGKTTVFAGLSGVGKSTLLNSLYPDLNLATGEVSEKNNKGKHTTRFSHLLPIEDGYIVDTPGFTFTDMTIFTEREVAQSFKEFLQYSPSCKFNTCLHIAEPDCKVKEALLEGKIAQNRYDNYLEVIGDIKKVKERKNK